MPLTHSSSDTGQSQLGYLCTYSHQPFNPFDSQVDQDEYLLLQRRWIGPKSRKTRFVNARRQPDLQLSPARSVYLHKTTKTPQQHYVTIKKGLY